MWHQKILRPMLLLACMTLFVAGSSRADAPAENSALDKQLSDALRDMHNRAADLFNVNKDFPGAYRVFQGGLYMARPMLAHRPDVQQILDAGMQEAERLASMPERAMRLHKTIEDVRAKLKPASGVKPADSKPMDPKPAETKPPPMSPAPPKAPEGSPFPGAGATTLWKRLGSDEGVKKIVDNFFTLVIIDPKVDFSRNKQFPLAAKEEEALKSKLVSWISSVSDGSLVYTGKSMADAHKGMAITNSQFDALVESFRVALASNKVAEADVDELMKKANATRADIVGK